MSKESERQAFIDQLKENIYDTTTRKVFADWLEDNDEPELADLHRTWTKDKYHGALVRLEQYARDCSDDYDYEDGYDEGGRETYTLEQFVQLLKGVSEKGESICLNHTDIPVWSDNDDALEQIWADYELYTEQIIKHKPSDFIICAC